MKKLSFIVALLCASMMAWAIDSEYCGWYGDATKEVIESEDVYVTLTWETDASGNVVITMENGPGATSCSFRNGGFEGGIGAFVVSTDNFETTTPASDYFTAVQVYAGDTYTLTKIAEVPANAKIKHVGAGHAFSWFVNEISCYGYPDFTYTYGGICAPWEAPTGVAVDADSIITFTGVVGAERYIACVYYNGSLKYEQIVASGDVLHFEPLISGTYQVSVITCGKGRTDSNPSTAYDWELTSPGIIVGASEYCTETMSSGDTEVAFTWNTNNDGSIVISLTEVLHGENPAAHFRGNGMAVDNFKVGYAQEDGGIYFNHSCTGNTVTLTLKSPSKTPIIGEKIYYNAVVEYATTMDTNAWPTLEFNYTYGSKCSSTPTAIDNIGTNADVYKLIENGQLVIIKNGVKYNVAGQQVK